MARGEPWLRPMRSEGMPDQPPLAKVRHRRLVARREVARKHLGRLGGLHFERGCGRSWSGDAWDGKKQSAAQTKKEQENKAAGMRNGVLVFAWGRRAARRLIFLKGAVVKSRWELNISAGPDADCSALAPFRHSTASAEISYDRPLAGHGAPGCPGTSASLPFFRIHRGPGSLRGLPLPSGDAALPAYTK